MPKSKILITVLNTVIVPALLFRVWQMYCAANVLIQIIRILTIVLVLLNIEFHFWPHMWYMLIIDTLENTGKYKKENKKCVSASRLLS